MPGMQAINVSADYAQDEEDSDEERCPSPLAVSHALLKARLSQGSNCSKLNNSESLKSLLHLDQYSFFTDIDVQEAQLQVCTHDSSCEVAFFWHLGTAGVSQGQTLDMVPCPLLIPLHTAPTHFSCPLPPAQTVYMAMYWRLHPCPRGTPVVAGTACSVYG